MARTQKTRKTILAFTHGRHHPSTRFRILQFADVFWQNGWQIKLHVFWPPAIPMPVRPGMLDHLGARLTKLLRTARTIAAFCMHPNPNTVLVSRETPTALFPFLVYSKKLIIDFDDAVHLGSESRNFAALCRRASRVVAGNAELAAAALQWNPRTVIIPTVVDTRLYRVKTHHAASSVVRVGWIGSDYSIRDTLLPLLPLLADLQKSLAFEFIAISRPRPQLSEPGLAWHYVEWSPAVEQALADFIDIGIMPLSDTEYQRAKCGAKLLQYMAAAIPAIVTPLGVNTEIVQHDDTGLHAGNDREWREGLTRLIGDADLRARLGKAGRARACEHYSVDRWGPVWKSLLAENDAKGT